MERASTSLCTGHELAPTDHGLILSAATTALALVRRTPIAAPRESQALKQFSETDDVLAADRTAKAGLLVAVSGEELEKLFARLADVAVETKQRPSLAFLLPVDPWDGRLPVRRRDGNARMVPPKSRAWPEDLVR